MAASIRPDFTDRVYAAVPTETLDEQLRRLTNWAEIEAEQARLVAMRDIILAALTAEFAAKVGLALDPNGLVIFPEKLCRDLANNIAQALADFDEVQP